MSNDAARSRLRDIIAERSLKRGAFKLASGGASGFFFDMKPTVMDPEGANLVAELVIDALDGAPADCIGGLVMGAVPIAAAVAVKSLSYGARPIPAFYVRKEPKERGTEQLIEGICAPGTTAVVIEDVTTKGNSALKAAHAVRAIGCRVDRVVTIVDRLDGARATLAGHGLELIALFTLDDFQS